ncbi:MAG: hypothetical protein C7B43_13615 [Sulfobacillus benefaciens]|jgi:hypothetical protein|uniref:Uncharacterized protein n=1 Tax=Sulfobacillus benefaciens TaxID=453960 RepID=A0A2T2WW92_9FIRM|nr:MAG: hypothetical protein C7B43_13615 [Sulfobacillus benefaciens]
MEGNQALRTITLVIAALLIAMALGSASTPVLAASGIRLIVSPKPLKAPSETTFIVVTSHSIPTRLQLQLNTESPVRIPLKKEAAHTYAASHFIRSTGRLKVVVAGKDHRILLQKSYAVSKAPSNIVGKVIIAVIFFGVSIWYWRKGQRYTASPKTPEKK